MKLKDMVHGAKCLVLGAMVAVGLVATAAEPEAVQLWEGGPYWATVNVGTSEVQDHLEYGGLYTFGEAAQAVTDALGTGWRLPTKEDFDKLVSDEYCISVWDDTKKGYTFTSKSDSSKSIFLPAAGRDDGMGREDTAGTLGNYWSSMENGPGEAWGLRFSMNEGASASPIDRTLGIRVSVRAVKDPPLPITLGEVKSHEPWDGKFDVEYTLKGLEADVDYKVAFDVTAAGKSVSVTNAAAKLESKTYTNTLDTTELFGAITTDKEAEITARLIKLDGAKPQLGGVQLWEGGPFFAECNVGAEKPTDYGWYFWWGDTVGYTNNGATAAVDKKWVSVADGTTTIQFNSSDETAKKTFKKSGQGLKDEGFSDDALTGVLNAAHDAATAQLGAPWRMPTKDELDKLVDKEVCQQEWVTEYKGVTVKGRVVKGKAGSAYANNEVFFPAAGYGNGKSLSSGSRGYYWSSTPPLSEEVFNDAWIIYSDSSDFEASENGRYFGCSVRAVRDAK